MSTNLRVAPMPRSIPQDGPERELPQNLDAERSVLGSLLVNPSEKLEPVRDILKPSDFYRENHQLVYGAILDVHDRDGAERVDTISIGDQLGKKLEELSDNNGHKGPAFLESLTDGMPIPFNTEHWAELVRRKSLERSKLRLLEQATEKTELGDSIAEELAAIESIDNELAGATAIPKPFTIDELLALPESEECAFGLWRRGEIGLLVGREGLGKTALGLQLSAAVATGADWYGLSFPKGRVLFLELEFPATATRERIERFGLAEQMRDRVEFLTLERLRHGLELPIDLRMLVKLSAGFDLVIIDSLRQAHTAEENSNTDMAPVMRALRQVATETQCVCVALHHEPKAVENPLDAVRGATVIGADSRGTLRIHEDKGVLCLRVIKADRHARGPLCWLDYGEEGAPFAVDQPPDNREKGKRNREAIREQLESAGDKGVSREDLETATGLSRRTVYDHLKALGASKGQGSLFRFSERAS